MKTLLLTGLWMLCLATAAQAQAGELTTYGKWEVAVGSDFVVAYTVNDQGQRFSLTCSDECSGTVSAPSGCNQASPRVALFNSDAGVAPLKLACVVYEGDANFVFDEDVSGAFKHKTDAAFAFPGSKATFTTMRFSLDGASEALAHVLREARKRK